MYWECKHCQHLHYSRVDSCDRCGAMDVLPVPWEKRLEQERRRYRATIWWLVALGVSGLVAGFVFSWFLLKG